MKWSEPLIYYLGSIQLLKVRSSWIYKYRRKKWKSLIFEFAPFSSPLDLVCRLRATIWRVLLVQDSFISLQSERVQSNHREGGSCRWLGLQREPQQKSYETCSARHILPDTKSITLLIHNKNKEFVWVWVGWVENTKNID